MERGDGGRWKGETGGGGGAGRRAGLPLEIRESRGNIAAAMNTIPLPVIAHAVPSPSAIPSCQSTIPPIPLFVVGWLYATRA